MRSTARCFAVPISQAPGRSGTPSTGHCSSAATRASCASSSAVPMSPTTRASPAMSRADSIRQITSIARCASVDAGSIARAPSHSFHLNDLTDFEGVAVEGCPLEPLDCLVNRAHLPQPIATNQLLGLREWPVDDGAFLAVKPHALALGARVEAAIPDDHPRLDQLLVVFLELRHSLRRRGRRRRALFAFLCQYQYTHPCLLSYIFRIGMARALRPSPTYRMKDGPFDMVRS